MDTSYEAHRNSQTFLKVAHRAWCDRYHIDNAMGEYDKWIRKNMRAEIHRIWSSVFLLLAVIVVMIQFMTGHFSWLISALAFYLLLISYSNKQEKDSLVSHGSTPNEWNRYQKDLARLLARYPAFERECEKVHKVEDAKRIVGAELEPYGRQVDAKQRLGLVVDARNDRNEMFSMGEASFVFGFSGPIDQYFPEGTLDTGKKSRCS